MTLEEAMKLVRRNRFGYILHSTVPEGFVVIPSLLGPQHSYLKKQDQHKRDSAAAVERYN